MYLRFFIFTLSYISCISPLYSQSYFEKAYGSVYDDEAHFIATTSDGGFIVTGKTKARTGTDNDIFLLKISKTGAQEWFKVIDNNGEDWGRGVAQTTDGGYIVCGEFAVSAGSDYTLAKFDAAGNKLWQKNYHGKTFDRASSLQLTSDGGFFVCGYSETSSILSVDGFLLKTDNAGTIEWSKLVDAGSNEALYGMAEVADGYITTGYTDTGNAGYITKVSKTGTLLWSKKIEAGSGPDGFFQSSLYNSNVFTARGTDRSGTRDIWVYKFDLDGNPIWSKALGTSSYDEAFGIAHSANGDFVVAGLSMVSGASYNGSIVRCDENGTLLWSKSYGGNAEDRLYDIKAVGSNGHVACGFTTSNGTGGKDIYIVRIDNDGNAGADCSYNTAGISATDFTPTITALTPAISDNTIVTTISPASVQTAIVAHDLCETTSCDIDGNLFLPAYEICNLNPLTLDAKNPGYTYLWSTGETSQTISVHAAGNYWVDITNGPTCSLRVETKVTEFSISQNIGSDQTICPGQTVTLHAPLTNNNYHYLWSNGSTGPSLITGTAGEYFVTVSYQDCSTQTNSVNLSVVKDDIIFPNLVTRNNDGENDVLKFPVQLLGGSIIIVNRWGKTVYQNSIYNNDFDGKELSDGIYYYNYKTPCDKDYKSWVQIISE